MAYKSIIDDPIVTTEEAAKQLKVSFMTLWRMHKKGIGPARIQLSPKRVGYRQSEIDKWVENRSARAE